MGRNHLATYLHDHLSGAGGAIELVGQLLTVFASEPVAEVLKVLHRELLDERRQLEGLAAHYPLATAAPRKAVAWLAEKGLEAKLALDGFGEQSFRLFEALEALSIGIAGKRLLWRTLAQEAATEPQLVGPAYAQLIAQAVRQRRSVEPMRQKAAQRSFGAYLPAK